jgi:predicted small secreted protein
MRILRLAVAVALAAAVAACSTSAGSGPDPGSTAAHPSQYGSAAPQTMTSRDDIVSPRPVRWDSWRLVNPTTVEVTFLAGPADCDGVKATADETADHVTIGLLTGPLPGSGECRAIALTTTTRVTLSRPLGHRQVRQP